MDLFWGAYLLIFLVGDEGFEPPTPSV
jgi:hypothetical protein